MKKNPIALRESRLNAPAAPTVSLITLHVEAFPSDQLPPDLANVPAVKPGSK